MAKINEAPLTPLEEKKAKDKKAIFALSLEELLKKEYEALEDFDIAPNGLGELTEEAKAADRTREKGSRANVYPVNENVFQPIKVKAGQRLTFKQEPYTDVASLIKGLIRDDLIIEYTK